MQDNNEPLIQDYREPVIQDYNEFFIQSNKETQSKWNVFIDKYLTFSDRAIDLSIKILQKAQSLSHSKYAKEPDAKWIYKLTLGALFIVFIIILSSCATRPDDIRFPKPMKKNSLKTIEAIKTPEPLYTRRERKEIKLKESGSKTGSMWADTTPRDLYTEVKPHQVGEVLTVLIPEELRFYPPKSKGNKASLLASAKGAKEPSPSPSPSSSSKSEKGEKAAGGQELPSLTFTSPYAVGYAAEFNPEPVKDFKMEIIAFEPLGDIYLRGIRDFKNNFGENRKIMVMAKIPRRLVQEYKIDARDLTAVTINEIRNEESTDYAATGWDKTISRKLAGFVPDLDTELSALEDLRGEMEIEQNAVKEQQKAINEERALLFKERQMLQNSTNTAEKNPSNTTEQNAPGAQGPGGNPAGNPNANPAAQKGSSPPAPPSGAAPTSPNGGQ